MKICESLLEEIILTRGVLTFNKICQIFRDFFVVIFGLLGFGVLKVDRYICYW